MERMRCSRVEISLACLCPLARKDSDSDPTKPFPGKFLISPCLKCNQHLSQIRIKNPSSRQATSIGPNRRGSQARTSCPNATGWTAS